MLSLTHEVVLTAEHWPHLHPVLDIPEGEPVPKQVLIGAGHLEVDLDLPVPDPAGYLVPDGAFSGLLVGCEADVVTGDHGAPEEIPVWNPEPGSWNDDSVTQTLWRGWVLTCKRFYQRMFPFEEVLWIPFCRDQCECQEEREPSLMILMTHLKFWKR